MSKIIEDDKQDEFESSSEDLPQDEVSTEVEESEDSDDLQEDDEPVLKFEKPRIPKAKSSRAAEEFDWDKIQGKGYGEGYSEEERHKLESMIDGTLRTVTEKEVVEGVVVGITDRDVIVNIGFKSDGLVPLNEFRDTPDLKIGQKTNHIA